MRSVLQTPAKRPGVTRQPQRTRALHDDDGSSGFAPVALRLCHAVHASHTGPAWQGLSRGTTQGFPWRLSAIFSFSSGMPTRAENRQSVGLEDPAQLGRRFRRTHPCKLRGLAGVRASREDVLSFHISTSRKRGRRARSSWRRQHSEAGALGETDGCPGLAVSKPLVLCRCAPRRGVVWPRPGRNQQPL